MEKIFSFSHLSWIADVKSIFLPNRFLQIDILFSVNFDILYYLQLLYIIIIPLIIWYVELLFYECCHSCFGCFLYEKKNNFINHFYSQIIGSILYIKSEIFFNRKLSKDLHLIILAPNLVCKLMRCEFACWKYFFHYIEFF